MRKGWVCLYANDSILQKRITSFSKSCGTEDHCSLFKEKTTEAKMMKAGGTEIGKTLAEKSRGLFSANDWQCKTWVFVVRYCFWTIEARDKDLLMGKIFDCIFNTLWQCFVSLIHFFQLLQMFIYPFIFLIKMWKCELGKEVRVQHV